MIENVSEMLNILIFLLKTVKIKIFIYIQAPNSIINNF